MAKTSPYESGELTDSIFLILLTMLSPVHGYGIMQKLSELTDGKVVIVEEVEEPEYFKGKRIQVSVFMSFFNVHVNWFPLSGEVVHYKYHPGKYVAAFYPKSSEKNERTTIVIRNENGTEILTRQIAGLFARRVVCYAQ